MGIPGVKGGDLESPTQTPEHLRRTLTFAERAADQYAIEEVYWRHRIWPRSGGENPGPKPALATIVSRRQIEHKVEDYQHKSQLVADRRGWPISGSELQTEMERTTGVAAFLFVMPINRSLINPPTAVFQQHDPLPITHYAGNPNEQPRPNANQARTFYLNTL